MTVQMVPGLYVPDRSLPARIGRRLIQWRTVAPITHHPRRPIISFTFDDFPKSAAEAGARIVESAGIHATYYAATSLAGKQLVLGEMYRSDDLIRLQASGHEIGSHTHSHRDCARMSLSESLADIERGDTELLATGLREPARQFAYPFGETTTALKTAMASRYAGSRGILAGINRKGSDRSQLRSVELGDCPTRMKRAFAMIESAVETTGWLIFYTHDVRDNPSAYGISPDKLLQVVDAARKSGAELLTVGAALERIAGAAA